MVDAGRRWLPLPAVYGLKGHSLVFDTGDRVPAEAPFLDYREASGEVQAPELFPRADGTTYVCAISSESPLPVDPAAVVPDDGAIERLHAMCRAMSPVLGRGQGDGAQACFRPVTRDGLPLIGRVPGIAGAYVATGHSVWGILNAPATGEAMAELITDGADALDSIPAAPVRPAPACCRLDLTALSAEGEHWVHSRQSSSPCELSSWPFPDKRGPGRVRGLSAVKPASSAAGRRRGRGPARIGPCCGGRNRRAAAAAAASAPSRNSCSRREPLKMPCAPPRVSAVRVMRLAASPTRYFAR